jgi:hypothetical protein
MSTFLALQMNMVLSNLTPLKDHEYFKSLLGDCSHPPHNMICMAVVLRRV